MIWVGGSIGIVKNVSNAGRCRGGGGGGVKHGGSKFPQSPTKPGERRHRTARETKENGGEWKGRVRPLLGGYEGKVKKSEKKNQKRVEKPGL